MIHSIKKPPTDMVELCFQGPAEKKQEAMELLYRIGFTSNLYRIGFTSKVVETIPWREAFPEISEGTLPGVCLRGARHREGITQKRLAELTSIPQRHLSEMENGKRPIGKKNAQILGDALGVGYKVFL